LDKPNRRRGRPRRQLASEQEPDRETLKEENRQLKERLKLTDPLSSPATSVPRRPNLSDKQWKALEFEIRRLTDNWTHTEGWPSNAPAERVAQHACVSKPTIYTWRQNPEYRRGLYRLASEGFSSKVSVRLKKNDILAKPAAHQPAQTGARMHSHIKNNWCGPIESPVDRNSYGTAEGIFRHALDERMVLMLEERCGLCSGYKPLVRQRNGQHFCPKCVVYVWRFVDRARQDISVCVIDAPASRPSGL